MDEFLAFRSQGLAVALVTLVGSEGGSPRPLGSQMVVAGNGDYAGHLTGGCAEAVIADEACAALAEGQNRTLRLGAGSGYLDVQLPCGASVELLIDVTVDDEVMHGIRWALRDRQPVALETVPGAPHRVVTAQRPMTGDGFRRWYYPRRRLLVYGKGPNASTLARLAAESDLEVSLYSPDKDTLSACEGTGVSCSTLTSPASVMVPPLDPLCAVVLMFHEHDWEPPLLRQLLQTEAYYVGALGSRRTHERRCAQLMAEGFDQAQERIRGPVGLDIGAGNPVEIAVSILAEMIQVYRQERGQAPLLTRPGDDLFSPAS